MNPSIQPNHRWQFRSGLRCALAALILAPAVPTLADVVSLVSDDPVDTSSFIGWENWSNFEAPSAVHDYFTGSFILRTPTGGDDHTFAGASLSINTNGTLSLKGWGTITVNDLRLDAGGIVAHNGTGGDPDTATLAGNITLQGNAELRGGETAGATTLNVLASISGDAGLTIRNPGTVVLSAPNTYTGQTTVNNGVLRLNHAQALPDNDLRVEPGATAAGTLDLNGHDVTVGKFFSGNANTVSSVVTNSSPTDVMLTVGSGTGGSDAFMWRGTIHDGGAGKIGYRKIGEGFQRFDTVQRYSGDTTISEGTLTMGASLLLPWGTGRGNLIVNIPGTLQMSGRSVIVNGLFGDGTIDNSATGNSTLHFGSNDVTSVFSGRITSTGIGLLQLQKWGAGAVTLSGDNTFNGAVNVRAGILRITQNTGLGIGTKTITVSSTAGDAGLHLDGSGGDLTLDASLAFQTAGTNGAIVSEAGNNTIFGPISLITGGSTKIRADSGSLTVEGGINILANVSSRTLTLGGAGNGTVNGVIADGSSANDPNTNLLAVTKADAGTWTLNNANTYSDVTTVAGGTLRLGAGGSIANSSTINVRSGATFDVIAVPGGWSLGASGGKAIKGHGTIAGNVIINGRITPGDALIDLPIGTLTFSHNLTLAGTAVLELNRTNSPNADRISAATIALGGTLTVTNIGDPLQAGDTFNLFDGDLSGAFAVTNLPVLSEGLSWDTSLLASEGVIKVEGGAAPPSPEILPVTVIGGAFSIQFPSEPGFNYSIESTTNLAAPAWIPLTTNVGGGVIGVDIPIVPAVPKQFFRVRVSAP